MEKILFNTHTEFEAYRLTYWLNTQYCRYYITMPERFPCVAIERNESVGRADDLGSVVDVDTFVYLTDFVEN
jgi:hypothetical protein